MSEPNPPKPSKKDPKPSETLEDFLRQLAPLSPSDFDGHTEFDSLTPDQKLLYLSQLILFRQSIRKKEK